MSDLISRQAAIDAIRASTSKYTGFMEMEMYTDNDAVEAIEGLPPEQPESARTFVELVVEYLDPEVCIYKEYKGKPYYSIKYIENGETHVGYGTYKPEVLSQFLKEYFILSAQPEIVGCKDCKHRGKQISDGRYWCGLHYAFMHYCSDAERRTDE